MIYLYSMLAVSRGSRMESELTRFGRFGFTFMIGVRNRDRIRCRIRGSRRPRQQNPVQDCNSVCNNDVVIHVFSARGLWRRRRRWWLPPDPVGKLFCGSSPPISSLHSLSGSIALYR
jgi:hypothetical protein